MNTEELIEKLIDVMYPIYKRNSKGCIEAYKLDRKEPVDVDGITFSCWREYVCYKVSEYLKEKCPEADIKLELNGNDTQIFLEINDNEQQKLNQKIYTFLENNF